MDRLISEKKVLDICDLRHRYDIPYEYDEGGKHIKGYDEGRIINMTKLKQLPSAEPYKGMTNGEVIKAVFGFEPRTNTCIIPKSLCNGNPTECDGCKYDDWWNSPYEPKESEE